MIRETEYRDDAGRLVTDFRAKARNGTIHGISIVMGRGGYAPGQIDAARAKLTASVAAAGGFAPEPAPAGPRK